MNLKLKHPALANLEKNMDKQKFILALQSKINLLGKRIHEAKLAQRFEKVLDMEVEKKTYESIQSKVIAGDFDK